MANPTWRCKYWPKGCKVRRRFYWMIKAHEKNCRYMFGG